MITRDYLVALWKRRARMLAQRCQHLILLVVATEDTDREVVEVRY